MASTIGLGTTLEINDGVANAFQAVAGVVSIDPPDAEVQVAESKRLDLSNGLLGKVAATSDPGQFTFQYEYDSTLYSRLDGLKGVSKSFKITPNGGSARTVPGFIVQNKQDPIEPDTIMTATCTVQVNGAVS